MRRRRSASWCPAGSVAAPAGGSLSPRRRTRPSGSVGACTGSSSTSRPPRDRPRAGRAGRGGRRCHTLRPGGHLPPVRRRPPGHRGDVGAVCPPISPTSSGSAPGRRHEAPMTTADAEVPRRAVVRLIRWRKPSPGGLAWVASRDTSRIAQMHRRSSRSPTREPYAPFLDMPVGGGGSGGRSSPCRGVHHARSAGSARRESYQETAV